MPECGPGSTALDRRNEALAVTPVIDRDPPRGDGIRGGGQQAPYAFTRGLDYPSIVAASEKVAWTVEEVFHGRRFDASGAIVPAAWVGTRTLGFLDAGEQLVLNHCRAFSYVHLLGNFEEFVPLHLAGVIQRGSHADRAHLRALLRFGEEEIKHQQLFLRAERLLEDACGHRFGRYFDEEHARVTELTGAILDHPPLARFLIVLALEWGTQRHYVESVRDRSTERGDPLYVDMLKAHWLEEAQHTKSDMLEIARLAEAMNAAELSAVFEHLGAIGSLVDAAFVGQAQLEVETLERVTRRTLPAAEGAVLRDTLYCSLSASMAGIGLTHPSFAKVARALSTAGAAKLGLGVDAARPPRC